MTVAQGKLPDGVTVSPVRAFSDNYIWCLHNNTHVVVVDPGEAQPVLTFCRENSLTLSAILITHHHHDHTGGIEKLISTRPDIPVIGPRGGHIRGVTQSVVQGDTVSLADLKCEFSVIEVPGHTLDHLAFAGQGLVFCGDTLFAAGCGRLFEGSAAQMLHSLNKLQRLPDDTLVYCAHEYTQSNIRFAKAVEPENQELQDYALGVENQRKDDKPTIPSDIKTQKAVNPFLRVNEPNVVAAANSFSNQALNDEVSIFASLRKWKDEF
ncbi:hydroxyacylglutathione hydrolase [Alteromonas pelagimontana]|uniref:Hydroxyacylglutathione hydrolase n=1 Tax=Alteromonas pelagimontana TaxID=1858656 RepID=A0A6M4MGL0_9ALTE|nr:hydroxyacylglutathione hydrolase [Alteromonas pelagimontana]QJR82259.1 hydroxyacylglutathione hydrolase [Alteromonas pelagimontana]